jgi:hypothetical protein
VERDGYVRSPILESPDTHTRYELVRTVWTMTNIRSRRFIITILLHNCTKMMNATQWTEKNEKDKVEARRLLRLALERFLLDRYESPKPLPIRISTNPKSPDFQKFLERENIFEIEKILNATLEPLNTVTHKFEVDLWESLPKTGELLKSSTYNPDTIVITTKVLS